MSAAQQVLPGITSVGEAQQVIADLGRIMQALLAAVQEETALVRAGKLSDAEHLASAKSELAGNYLAATERLKSSRQFLMRTLPEQLAELRRLHDTFHAVLQINLTVLATAHAVSEGIVRGVSEEINRLEVPQTYGATGRASNARPKNRQPMAVSRSA
jgi:hypothetical protein